MISSLFGQQTVNHHVDFSSGLQNMWGPSWSAFSINQTTTLFEVNWDEPFDTGNGAITTIAGQQFGFAVAGNFSGTIGSEFSLQGFTTGEVEVDYPIDVVLDMPTDLTYDQGDPVTIETDYTVASNYALDTYYPSAGEATLDLYFQMGAGLSATLCAFGCTSFPIIPQFNTGLQTINIFTVNTSEISFFSFNGSTPLYSYNIFPLSTTMIPGDPLGNFGLSAELDLPYVTTSDNLIAQDLEACGEDTYLNMNLDIFALLGNIPGPVGAVLGNLSGSQPLIFGAEIYWNLFSASLDVNIHNKQCFDFTPKVYAKLEFPVAVEYQIFDPGGGLVSASTSSIINVELGNDVEYKFPCYYEELDIIPTYSIDGIFRNHTFDSISFDFLMSAFAFGITIPPIEITPEINVPEICVPIAWPCPTWSKPWRWCSGWACTPAFTIPAVGYSGDTFGVGPLWNPPPFPLGYVKYDWFDDTWSLEGFSDSTFTAFTMIASPLGISNTFTDILCHGDATGSINVTTSAVSHALPYTYNWTNGATTQNISNLAAGPYEVEVYDNHGCQLFTGATISHPVQPLTITFVKTNKSCFGGVDDGSINILVQGGTAPYTYSWTNGATTEDVSGLAAGVYTVTVTDANACVETATVTITEPTILGQTGAATHNDCFGAANGQIAIDVYGGTLPYSYAWDSGHTVEDITDLTAGFYELTVSDGNNCQSVEVYEVQEPATPVSLSITGIDVNCKGDSTGSIDLTTNGGTPGYTYQWSNGLGIVLPYTTEDLTNIPASDYTVSVTDANGCVEEISILINEPLTNVTSSPSLIHINCNGDATGAIDPNLSGGTLPYTYVWSNGSTTTALNAISAGVYTLTVTDGNGCITSFTYELTEPEALLINSDKVDVLCFGEATGEASTSVSGGVSGYSYLWSNGGVSSTISNLIAGNYNVVVTDLNGCVINDAIVVDQPLQPLNGTTVETAVDCKGNSTGAIDLTPSGGTSPYTYLWSTSGSVILVDTAQSLTGVIAGTYLYTITDNHGCQFSSSETVTEPLNHLVVSGVTNDVSCKDGNDGAINITATGGTPGYIFNWTNGATTEDINTLFIGSYSIEVTDNNGCTANESFVIEEPSAALVATSNVSDVSCLGGNDGYMTSFVTGGTAPYTYLWSNGATTANIYNLVAGAYSLTVTDANGCTAITGGVVKEPVTAISMTYSVVNVSCFGFADGEAEIVPSGGTPPYHYDWGNQGQLLMAAEGEAVTGLTVGDYFIRIIDDNGCVYEEVITISEPTLLESSFTFEDVLCFGESTGSIDLTVSGGTTPYDILWSTNETTEDISGLPAGQYSYSVTDDHGCYLEDSLIISQPNDIHISHYSTPITCSDQSDGMLEVSVAGGTEPYTYVWSNGEDSDQITNLDAGWYQLIVIDNYGCDDTVALEVLSSEDLCLNIPNTFTPNGDNYNDTWIIDNMHLYPNAEVRIFNKWGNELYTTIGEYIPWDGKVNGVDLPSEVYYFIILLNNESSEKYTGVITIIR